jgi:hypothetical protein
LQACDELESLWAQDLSGATLYRAPYLDALGLSHRSPRSPVVGPSLGIRIA